MTLYANYLREPSAAVTALVYLSLAITLVSGFDYILRITRWPAAESEGRRRG